MKTQKNLMEMDATELRQEIGRLQTTLDRTATKNKRRRKALKELNTHALVNFKLRGDLQQEVRYLRQSVRLLTDTLEHYKTRATAKVDTMEIRHGEFVGTLRRVPEEPKAGFFSRIFTRNGKAKGVTGA